MTDIHLTQDSRAWVTVIVPVFNVARTIVDCLESVVRQDHKFLEVIVVDGASSDGTVELVQSIATRSPSLRVISEPDSGVYDAINKAVRVARGEWIYILGSDDRLASPSVFNQLSPILATDAEFIHAKILRVSTGLVEGDPVSGAEIALRNICQQAVLYRRTLFERLGGFDLKYTICADWAFNIRCFGIPCKVAFSELLLCYYDGRGMSSKATDSVFYADRLAIAIRAFGLPMWHRAFRPLRYLFLEDMRRYKAEGRHFRALGSRIMFLLHAVMAKFDILRSDR